jgi:hypothetical protein
VLEICIVVGPILITNQEGVNIWSIKIRTIIFTFPSNNVCSSIEILQLNEIELTIYVVCS